MARPLAKKDDLLPKITEIFREHGYQGASLSAVTAATGLGKGSLYHFFPGGKQQMADAALDLIDVWFEENIFHLLSEPTNPALAIEDMFFSVSNYFNSGQRVCLVGAMALESSRDLFAEKIAGYFRRWITALGLALQRCGLSDEHAHRLSLEIVSGIQGAIVLSRAIDDPDIFKEILTCLKSKLFVTA